MGRTPGFLTVLNVSILTGLMLLCATPASAQPVSAGPLTDSLPTTEPTSGIFSWGAVKFAPGLVISELGHDSNIFNEALNPKDDFLFRGTPDISAFSLLRFAKISAYAGSHLSYFKTYTDENSVGYSYRGRIDFLFSRVLPFIGVGETRERTRPTGEIDTRADERQQEVSAGLAFSLGPHSQIYVGGVGARSAFFNSVEDGVDLSESLNHDTVTINVGVQTAITPLTTLTVNAAVSEDRFESVPLRNSENRSIGASVLIGAEAVISGTISVSYVDSKPVDPTIEPHNGVQIQAGVTYPFLELGRFNFSVNRGMSYSFDTAEGYYEETTASIAYTHRLFGDIDVQAIGTKSWLDYGFKEGVEERTDTTESLGASFGYNLRNRTRISLNYEISKRRSPVNFNQNYDRTRIYLSWAYAY